MRKGIVFLFVFLFILAGAMGAALAATANTTQKGSVLVWPKITALTSMADQIENTILTDTFITLSNDGPAAVDIKCYWVDGAVGQDFTDFQFNLSKYKFYSFSAQNGGRDYPGVEVPPFSGASGEGFLACWAVDNSGANAVSWNHLYGTAWVVDFANSTAFAYNSWNFQARSVPTGSTPTNIVPSGPVTGNNTGGLSLQLNGTVYDACPAYLLYNFLTEGQGPNPLGYDGFNDLTLLPCKQDLRQDNFITKTKLKFDVWNNYETKLTNAWACSNCWWDNFLSNAKAIHYVSAFSARANFDVAARFRVTAVASTQCPGSVAAGLLGTLVSYLPLDGSDEAPFAFGTTGNAPATNGPAGFIYWDPADPDITR